MPVVEVDEKAASYPGLRASIVFGRASEAEAEVRAALEAGDVPVQIVQDGLIPAMDVVGEKYSTGEFFVPEMLTAARAMKHCMAVLEPLLAAGGRSTAGRIVLGTVKGDIHDIGKNIVSTMLQGGGFEVHDLGVDVPTERFVEVVGEERPDILGLSALLTTTMPVMKKVIAALEQAGVRDGVKFMVGGAPLTSGYAEAIGADAYAAHAGLATAQAKELVGHAGRRAGGSAG